MKLDIGPYTGCRKRPDIRYNPSLIVHQLRVMFSAEEKAKMFEGCGDNDNTETALSNFVGNVDKKLINY